MVEVDTAVDHADGDALAGGPAEGVIVGADQRHVPLARRQRLARRYLHVVAVQRLADGDEFVVGCCRLGLRYGHKDSKE